MGFAESVVEYTAPSRLGRPVPEARDCTALRDTLMPKVISGELRVGEAERMTARSA